MKGFKIPIGVKLNTIIISILLISFSSILYFATDIFKKDNRNNINALNAKVARANAGKVKEKFEKLSDTILTVSKIVTLYKGASPLTSHLINKSEIVAISIFSLKKKKKLLKYIDFNNNLIESFDLNKDNLKKLLIKNFQVFNPSFSGETKIFSEITQENFPLIYLSIPFEKDEEGEIVSIVVGAVNPNEILSIFKDESIFTTYLLDENGAVIAHPDNNKILNKTNYSSIPLIQDMLKQRVSTGQREFKDENGVSQLGAFSLVGMGGTGVISQVSKEKAYEATQKLIKKSIKLSLIVLIFTIIIIYVYSHSITSPIKILVKLTEKISSGFYNISITKKPMDEIGDLASAFEVMASGLKQRERLKNTFGKFVNKEIAEQAMKNELTLGGEKKKVTVFFSDIRGFTSLSENLEPEELLSTLNEYMSLMVSIITKWGGVVDKFVGDAIMAIWGAPFEKESDASNALMACLESRAALFEFNKERVKQGKSEIKIGMALNTGYAITGNIGSQEKMEYTAIGDSVNLAARIEGLTKELKSDILISEETLKELNIPTRVIPSGMREIRGKEEKIQVYKVLGVFKGSTLLNYKGDPNLKTYPDRDKDSKPMDIVKSS